MIRFQPEEISQDGWARAVAPFAGLSLTQCWEYGAAKAADGGWRAERGLLRRDGAVIGAAQVMVRDLPVVGGGLAWVSRGPLCGDDGDFTEALAALRRHYVSERGCYLRVAPPVAADGLDAAALAPAGFRVTDTPGWASARVNLAAAEAELRRGLRGNWRSHLGKAERSGIGVESGTDPSGFRDCVAEYAAFLAARGFATGVTPDLVLRLQELLPEDRRMIYFRGRHDGVSLGSVLIARYGTHAECLVNSVGNEGRRYGLGQLLVWRALCDMKSRGLSVFDVGGMDPVLTPAGVYDFKAGIGGTPYRLANEIEADDGGLRARLVRWRVARARQGESTA